MTQDFAIQARGLGKRYRRQRRGRQHDQLREAILSAAGTIFRRDNEGSGEDTFWALKDATFDVRRGENLGIIGLNGAGKSTLLKLLSRITTPTTGLARISGRLGALLEVGTGFHQELTGRENTFLYGAILGMSRSEVARKFDAIVDFAEIAEFIDMPVKRYSSGMYVRLAFAVAAHLDPEILLLDEVLAVGDFTFQRKCINFARELERKGATILFVSHNMHSIKSMCQRVIYLKRGHIVFDGPTDQGLKHYEQDCRLAPSPWFREGAESPPIRITDVAFYSEQGEAKSVFAFGERMRIRIQYEAAQPIDEPHFLLNFTRSDNVHCCSFSTAADHVELPQLNGRGTIELLTPPLKLVSEMYTASVVVRQSGFQRMLCAQIGATFHISHPLYTDTAFGIFFEPGEWRLDSPVTRKVEAAGELR
jgi:lipopolysaccharide transport system ATP-binding protein